MARYQISKIVSYAAFAASMAALLAPAFLHDKSFTQIVVSILEPELSLDYILRVIVTIVFIAASYVLIMSFIFRHTPLSVMATNFDIEIHDAKGTRVEVKREQIIRPNQPDVSAYFTNHSPSQPTGSIEEESIDAQIYCPSCDIDGDVELQRVPGRVVEVMHLFKNPLPYGWYMMAVPAWLFRGKYELLYKWIQKYSVRRVGRVVYVDELSSEKPCITFDSRAYTVRNFVMTIIFNEYPMPPRDEFRAIRIKGHAVMNVPFDYRQAERKIVISLDRLDGDRLRVAWPGIPN